MIREEEIAGALECFERLTKKNREILLKNAQRATFRKKERLPMGVAFFLVKRGVANAFTAGENGDEVFVYAVKGGCLTSEGVCYEFPGGGEIVYLTDEGVDALRGSAAFCAYLSDVAKRQEAAAVSRLNRIMFMSLERRLASFLTNADSRSRTHVVNLTQEEIARFVGTSREVVTRKLKVWEEDGLVACARGKVTILNKEELKKKRKG